jgi:hypothetical protein
MAKEKRFFKSYSQTDGFSSNEIWVDSRTGVNYLFHYYGNAAGCTVLVDQDGKPLLTDVSNDLTPEELND